MTISLPPTAPSRQDPATFSDRADAFAAWLVSAVPQFNALAVGSIDSGNFQSITVAGQITGNAVTQSPTDTTEGRLLTPGAGGLLRRLPSEPDLLDPDIFLNGVTLRNWASVGAANTPDSVDRGTLICSRSTTIGIHAFAFGEGGFAVNYSTDNGATWNGWKDGWHTGNTTVDSNGFVKEASPIVRLFTDGTQEPVEPVGAQFERLDVGEYRLSGVEPLAETGWQIEVPQDGNGNRLVFVSTEYDPEARTLTIITSVPAWDGGWVAGVPKDIPAGRWVDLRFKPLPEPEEEGDA